MEVKSGGWYSDVALTAGPLRHQGRAQGDAREGDDPWGGGEKKRQTCENERERDEKRKRREEKRREEKRRKEKGKEGKGKEGAGREGKGKEGEGREGISGKMT